MELLNARYVKAFVVGNKNDLNDAEAIFKAAWHPPGQSEERTALINQIRGHLAERGIVLPKSANQIRKQAKCWGSCLTANLHAQRTG